MCVLLWCGMELCMKNLRKASPSYTLLPEQIHSFIPASMHPSADMYWTPVCQSCTRGSWCGDDYRTHRRETDLWTNPQHHTAQGQQEKMQGRAVRQASQWITHGRARTNQRSLPGGGNLCQGKNHPVRAWARHRGMELQAMQFDPTLQRRCTQLCWMDRTLCPFSGALVRDADIVDGTFPSVLLYSSSVTPTRAGTSSQISMWKAVWNNWKIFSSKSRDTEVWQPTPSPCVRVSHVTSKTSDPYPQTGDNNRLFL